MLAFMLALSISAFASDGQVPIGGRTCSDQTLPECQSSNPVNSGGSLAAPGVLASDVTEVATSEDDSILEAVISYLKTIF